MPNPKHALTFGCLTALTFLGVEGARAQDQSFANTADYRSMLNELHQDPVRPTRMGLGTLWKSADSFAGPQMQESASQLEWDTERWHLTATKNPCVITWTNKQTNQSWTLNPTWTQGGASEEAKLAGVEGGPHGYRLQLQIAGVNKPASLALTAISPQVIRLSLEASFAREATHHLQLNAKGPGPLFGSGERFERVQLDGLQTTLHPEDLLGQPGHNWTYIPVPFLFTPRGLGLYLDTAEPSALDLRNVAKQQSFSVALGNASTDAYLFVGSPKEILGNYTALTGRAPLSPPWAFGNWICSYQGPETVLEEARKLRKDGIPTSAIWTFDVMGKGDVQGWPLWWTGYYPHPNEFTHQLHDMGFKALTYLHPYLRSVLDPYNLPNPNYEEGIRSGLFVLDEHGEPTGPAFEPFKDGNIDFTKPANLTWWEGRIRDMLLKDGFDGWMEDFGEWVHDTDRFAANVPGTLMQNLNPLFYHKLTYEIARRAKPDVVPFVRSGYAGSQGYTRVVWGGDQFANWSDDYGLPSVIRAGISAGLSGFSVWGPDIASNGHSKELWTRWVEFAALTPIMRNHRWSKPEGAVDVWYDKETVDLFRRYAKLHVSLFPYLYSYAQSATQTGLPLMRHLMLESPNDGKTYTLDDEYLLGEQLLVAPIIKEGGRTRSLYLPEGSWVNYWTGVTTEGARTITVSAPLNQIPIFVRAGTMIPFIDAETETLANDLAGTQYRTLSNDLTWRLFPSPQPTQSHFTLADGTRAETHWSQGRTEVQSAGATTTRNLHVLVPTPRAPQQVTLDGRTLNRTTKAGTGNEWRYEATTHTTSVQFSAKDFDLVVTAGPVSKQP